MGTPALIRGGSGTHEMFFRDTRNRLAHVTRPPLQWSRPRLLTEKIISDPAAVSRGPGEFDVIVLKSDYMLYHVRQSGSRTSINVVSEDVKGIGQPTLLASADRLDIFYRSWNRRLYHARKVGKSNWMVVDVGGRMTDLPTAVRLDDGSFRVYVRGTGGGLWESRRGPGDDDPWSSWMSVSDLLGAGPIQGSPSAVVVDGAVHVYARTPESAIRLFRFDGDWGSDIREGSYTGSPTASAEGAFSRGHQGTLNLLTQAGEIQLGGQLD